MSHPKELEKIVTEKLKTKTIVIEKLKDIDNIEKLKNLVKLEEILIEKLKKLELEGPEKKLEKLEEIEIE